MTLKRTMQIGLGGMALATLVVGVIYMPDLIRYIKIERM